MLLGENRDYKKLEFSKNSQQSSTVGSIFMYLQWFFILISGRKLVDCRVKKVIEMGQQNVEKDPSWEL